MKIIFLGSIIFSKYLLEHIIKKNIKIDLVLSLKKEKNSFKSDFYDLSLLASKHNIKNTSIKSINSSLSIKVLKNIKPDYIISLGWSEILSKKVLNIPKKGVIGYHPSLLPENRGRHPIIWSIALGLPYSGSTYFLMDHKIDNGKIISQKKIKINKNDNATNLYFKTIKTASSQIIDIIKQIKSNQIKSKKQDNKSKNYLRKRTYHDGQINWSSSNHTIHNLIRALCYPYPNAHFKYKKKDIKVLKSSLGKNNNSNVEYGKIISINNNYFEVKCGISSIKIFKTNPKINLKLGDYL